MTDLNRKPYTIQMIQNDGLVGKGGRLARPRCSRFFLHRWLSQTLSNLWVGNALCWASIYSSVLSGEPKPSLGVERSETRSNVRSDTSHLCEESLTLLSNDVMFHPWIKRGFLKGNWGLPGFSLIGHTPTPWSTKDISAAHLLLFSPQLLPSSWPLALGLFAQRSKKQFVYPKIAFSGWEIICFEVYNFFYLAWVSEAKSCGWMYDAFLHSFGSDWKLQWNIFPSA